MAIVENFEQLLTDFFKIYHPRQVAKVDAIAQEFKGQEITVLKTLCDKYKKAYKVIPGLEEALAAPAPVIQEPVALEATEEVDEQEENIDEVEETTDTLEENEEEEVVSEEETEEKK